MLRRKPTALGLTSEDIAIYEDARAREAQQAMHDQGHETPNGKPQNMTPNSLKQPGFGAPQVKTREERLGLGVQGDSRG